MERIEGEKFNLSLNPETKMQGPSLKYLDTAFSILRQREKTELGEEESWLDLAERVRPFETGLEFSSNIREVVYNFIAKKIPKLKESVPSLTQLPEKELLEALTKNWFSGIGEEIVGKRKEVLLATMAHVVKRIENRVTLQVLSQLSEEELKKLNLNGSTRDLLQDVLKTSIKADPIFIRFMAYSQLSGKPPEEAGRVVLCLPGDNKLHTLPELFPHESQFLAKRFEQILEHGGMWLEMPGGEVFKDYLKTLVDFYKELNPEKAGELQTAIEDQYEKLLASDFPIIITPATGGYYKEPYYDPELKISLRTPDIKYQESDWQKMRDAMSDSLYFLGVEQFSDRVRKRKARSALVVGGFGVNIIFNAVAQGKPNILIFLNEQIQGYDREFPEVVLKWIVNANEIFGEILTDEKREFLESISRNNTVLHEFTHAVFPGDSPERKRFGRRPYTIIDEVKAEIVYRSLVPKIIEKGGLKGTKEEWAIGMLASSFQIARDQPPGDPYYYAAIYTLNDLFESGAVVMNGNQVCIKDFDLYYEVLKKAAEELLGLYRNEKMTEKKANTWIKIRCRPTEKVRKVLKIII